MTLGLLNPTCTSRKVQAAIDHLALSAESSSRGAVFTRREVVDFILDLADYTEDQPLHEKRLLEPSFGGGNFLLPIIERLLSAWRAARPNGSALNELGNAIRAVELHHDTFRSTHGAVVAEDQQDAGDVAAQVDPRRESERAATGDERGVAVRVLALDPVAEPVASAGQGR